MISKSTFNSLPKRFQAAARELAARGEIILEDNNIGKSVPGSASDHGTSV
jgi:TRAP-type C4-dicarboxylate transport system substrate-binding protein